MSETVQALAPLLAYQQSRPHLFSSLESIRWYVRQNRCALVEAGAILTVAGRTHVAPEAFDGCLLDLGRQAAKKSAM
jgi:hypothetical protein